MNRILVATTNTGKMSELQELLEGSGFELVNLGQMDKKVPAVEEDGVTFEENALKKAREYSAFYALPTIADDSGLEVKALGNKPGVFSARYAATDLLRNKRLLEEMKDYGLKEERAARFVCVAAYVNYIKGIEKSFEGSVKGYITVSLEGDRGFGFDPVFYYPPLKKTFAQMTMTQKNEVSHRRRAFGKLRDWLIKAQ